MLVSMQVIPFFLAFSNPSFVKPSHLGKGVPTAVPTLRVDSYARWERRHNRQRGLLCTLAHVWLHSGSTDHRRV
ncbi:hypothetical protein BZA77DRAFT_325413 [Pyronema omphalodes]|nr:hypothetical protein BZA77DRAFT_325413 [Pyronema omphalodes]